MYGVTAEASEGGGKGGGVAMVCQRLVGGVTSQGISRTACEATLGGNSDEVEALLHVVYSIPCMRERVLVRALA